jgi:hypothetical protein
LDAKKLFDEYMCVARACIYARSSPSKEVEAKIYGPAHLSPVINRQLPAHDWKGKRN